MEKVLNIKVESTGLGCKRRFSLATKIAAAEAHVAGYSLSTISEAVDVSQTTVCTWYKDYLAGKFTLNTAMSVARKPITITLVTLMQQIKSCEEKLEDLKIQARQRIDADYQAALAQLG